VRHTRIIVTHYGGPDALKVVEEECPEPKGGEVRVKVLAAGVRIPCRLAILNIGSSITGPQTAAGFMLDISGCGRGPSCERIAPKRGFDVAVYFGGGHGTR
jgi:hypothetical protein